MRLQLDTEKKYRGPIDCMIKMAKHEGVSISLSLSLFLPFTTEWISLHFAHTMLSCACVFPLLSLSLFHYSCTTFNSASAGEFIVQGCHSIFGQHDVGKWHLVCGVSDHNSVHFFGPAPMLIHVYVLSLYQNKIQLQPDKAGDDVFSPV